MAIVKMMNVGVSFIGDGVTASFTVDLLKDPYVVTNSNASQYLGTCVNWFANHKMGAVSLPIGVDNGGATTYSVSLSGTVVTVTYTPGNIPTTYDLVEFLVTFA